MKSKLAKEFSIFLTRYINCA